MRRRTGLRGMSALVGLAIVMSMAPGCGTSERAEPEPQLIVAQPRSGGRITYGLETDPNGLDPTRNAFDPVGIQLANALYDPAAAFDGDGRAQPYLARAFEHNPDFTQWTIRLRDGIRFHDGSPLDEAAALTFIQAVRTAPITREAARYITGATAGQRSVVLTMQRPWAAFPAMLTSQGGFIISPKQVADEQGHSRPQGTGPFKLERWERDRRISVVRNPDYWRPGLPYLDAVDFDIVPDGKARISGLTDGTLDATSVSSHADTRTLATAVAQSGSGARRIEVEADPAASEATFVMLNTAKPPFDNEHARRALVHATDREGLAKATNAPLEAVADGPFSPQSPWYSPVDGPGYSPAAARREVAAYERATGKKLTFEILNPLDEDVLQVLLGQWRAVGITATVAKVSITEAVPRAVAGWYEALQFRHFASVDPDINWHFWTSETIKPIGDFSLNFTRLADPDIDRALEAGRASPDPVERKRAYGVMLQRFAELSPYVWLTSSTWTVAHTSVVHDVHNVTLPDGSPAMPLVAGTHRLTETWVEA